MVDKHPQWLNLTPAVTNSTTIVTSETQVGGAIPEGHAMEILKVQYDLAFPTLASAGAVSGDEDNDLTVNIAAKDPGITAMNTLISHDNIDRVSAKESSQYAEATETGGGPYRTEDTIIHDLTDGNGRGAIWAPQSIFMQIQGSNATMTGTQRARILQRVVKVSANELIGLLRQ